MIDSWDEEAVPLRLTNHLANDRDPVWSPDGKQLAYCSFDFDSNYAALHDLLILTLSTGRPSTWPTAWPTSRSSAWSSAE